ncbi:sensor histidine kinase [Microbacterium sp. NPDC057650]|uniref:sensor histidine kinase n=1 Tax=unclassified Microbacterium TaxID=2609290 RepID=UPI00366C601A
MTRARSLRLQIVLIASALVAAASVIVGVVSVVSLNDYLLGQLDDRLVNTAQRGANIVGGLRPPGAPQPPDGSQPSRDDLVGAPGQPPGTVSAVFRDDEFVIGGWIDAEGQRHDLSDVQQKQLAAVQHDGDPITVDLGGDLGAYRVASRTAGSDDVVVSGLSMEPVTSVTARLTTVVIVVGLACILLAILAAALAMGRALRPLRRVAGTAAEVTSVPLGRGEVTLAPRVDQDDIASTAEVGQVGAALNDLLDHVERALAEREAGEQATRRFVADASHELRTPLTSIRAYAQLSERAGVEPEEMRGNAALIDAEGTRMSSLIDQMLVLARLDALPAMTRTDVDLRMLVAEAVAAARTAGPDHSWTMELGEDAAIVSGDAADLRRVVDNLLGNARLHTPPGTTVQVRVSADDGTVTLTVADDGPGLPGDLAAFDRFARGDASRSREEGGGTGLGLAIARAVVEAHGGTIDAVPGDGATFAVSLPGA